MNKTYTVIYLVALTVMAFFVFMSMKSSVSAVVFAVIFLVNVFLFADAFTRKGK